jgi:hypothetical protein
MDIKLSYVSEKDIDLLVIEELVASNEFCNLFLSKMNRTDFTLISIQHSNNDIELGESDITAIFSNGKIKHALLIEDKIDAVAMPNQCGRYYDRGNLAINNGKYGSFDIFLIAPNEYIESNTEAKKYPYNITYEELIEFFENQSGPRSLYKLQTLKMAVDKKQSGYVPQTDHKITQFNKLYDAYKDEHFPQLHLNSYTGDRGPRAFWPSYRSFFKYGHITHKSDKGYVDLMFRGLGEHLGHINNCLKNILEGDMQIVQTGKSGSVRIYVPIIDFKGDFDKQVSNLNLVFQAVDRLTKLTSKINAAELFSPINPPLNE